MSKSEAIPSGIVDTVKSEFGNAAYVTSYEHGLRLNDESFEDAARRMLDELGEADVTQATLNGRTSTSPDWLLVAASYVRNHPGEALEIHVPDAEKTVYGDVVAIVFMGSTKYVFVDEPNVVDLYPSYILRPDFSKRMKIS